MAPCLQIRIDNMPDSESDSEVVVELKAKERKSLQRYRADYSVTYPVVTKSGVGNTYAYCTVCRSDFSIRHGGIGDIAKHVKTSKHTGKVVRVRVRVWLLTLRQFYVWQTHPKIAHFFSPNGLFSSPKCTKTWSAGDPSGGACDAPPNLLVGWGGRHPLPIPLPLVAFYASNVSPPTDPSFSFWKVGMSGFPESQVGHYGHVSLKLQ